MRPCIDEFVSKKCGIKAISPLHNFGAKQASIWLSSIGTCERLYIKSVSDVEKLSNYYLVWYTINDKGQNGWNKQESYNYTLHDFTSDFIDGKVNTKSYKTRIKQLKGIIQELKVGLNQPIDVRVAYHSILNKALVIDGVKRIISLYYFMLERPAMLDNLFSSEHRIYILKFISDKCHEVFPCDFKKMNDNTPDLSRPLAEYSRFLPLV